MVDPIGAMRHRLRLEAPVDTTNAQGDVTRSWVLQAWVWAAIRPMDVAAGSIGEVATALSTYRVDIRWRAGIAAGQRLIHRGRVLEIRTVSDPDERRARLVLIVEQRSA